MKLVAIKYRSRQGARQQLDRVDYFQLQARAAGAVPELEHTAGVTGGEGVEVSLADLLHFGVQDRHGKLVLDDVVDSCTAAALIGAIHLDELDAGNGLQQLPRFGLDSLSMDEMAGIVVADTLVQRNFEPARKPRRGQKLGDVFHARGKAARAFQ